MLQHFFSNQGQNIKRISAHRQMWFRSENIELSPQERRAFDESSNFTDKRVDAFWKECDPHRKLSATLFDLVSNENSRARSITRYADQRNYEEVDKIVHEKKSPFDQLNELLELGTLMVAIENSNGEKLLARRQGVDAPFSIAQMSDGERNAVIIAAEVITAKPGTLLLIDEPERHLHRSIIEPFLSALLTQREDCAFVVSTHEIALPVAHPEAKTLMVRSCNWNNDRPVAWDVEFLQPNIDLPDELKLAILGSRKRIFFTEGNDNSLDLPLYKALFPGLSIKPMGNCGDVQKAVKGLRESQNHHHVEAFGLIDRDNRTAEEVRQLSDNNVFALDVYSVEALYYCSDAIAAVARRQAESLGGDCGVMIQSATQQAFKILEECGLADRMIKGRCKCRMQRQFFSKIPDWSAVSLEEPQKIEISLDSYYQDESTRFQKFIDKKNLDGIVARYPIRNTKVFGSISMNLAFRKRRDYEQALITLIRKDNALAGKLKQRLGSLSDVLITHS